MVNEIKIPKETKKSLQNFAVAYYFVFKVQLENAELIEQCHHKQKPKNLLLAELAHGYINAAITEFSLLLYDSHSLLKKSVSGYEINTDGAIAKIIRFRRHQLAHRACNWGSKESLETIESLKSESIYNLCHESAKEFVMHLRKLSSFF